MLKYLEPINKFKYEDQNLKEICEKAYEYYEKRSASVLKSEELNEKDKIIISYFFRFFKSFNSMRRNDKNYWINYVKNDVLANSPTTIEFINKCIKAIYEHMI